MAVLRSRLCVAYRGADDGIYLMMFDGSDWTPPVNAGAIVNARTSDGPAMVEYEDELLVVYKHPETHDLYAFSFDGRNPSPQIRITDLNGVAAWGSPSAAHFEDTVHIVYRGEETTDLWTCTFDGFRASTPENLTRLTGARTAFTPSLVVRDRELFVCYRGEGETHLSALKRGAGWGHHPIDLSDDFPLVSPDGFGLSVLGEPLLFRLLDHGALDPTVDISAGDAILAVARAQDSSTLVASLTNTVGRRPRTPRLGVVHGSKLHREVG